MHTRPESGFSNQSTSRVPHLPDAEVATGPNGQRAHRILLEHRQKVAPGPVPVRNDLFCLMGVCICNTQLIVTPNGIVVVDTGLSDRDGEAILEWTARVSPLPIIAVVYTHSHYPFGTGPILERYPGIPVIAHRRLHRNAVASMVGPRRFMMRRASMESARFLPPEGEDADATGSTIFTPGTLRYVRPTVELTDEIQSMNIGGTDFIFHTAYPFDTNDTLMIWLPDQRAIIHNHFASNFPNIYPIQGGRYRDPEPWLAGIDCMRAYRPEHLLSTHGQPDTGEDRCLERLTAVRDALQFVHDQTIRGMNLHLTPDELVAFVQLPDALHHHRDIQQTYGLVRNHVRGVFSGRAGWFDGDAATMDPPAPEQEARHVIEAFGGFDAATRLMEAALERKEYQWAARIGKWLLHLAPDNSSARSLQATALRALGQRTTAWTVRNYYLSAARALERTVRLAEPEYTLDLETALQSPAGTFVRALAFRCNPALFPPRETTVGIGFRDPDFGCALVLRRGIAEYLPTRPQRVDCSIRCDRSTWIRAADGIAPFSNMVDNHDVELHPDRETVRAVLRSFDPE